MEKWILAAGCDGDMGKLRKEWFRQGIVLHTANNVEEVVSKLYKNTACLLIIFFSEEMEHLPLLKLIREMTKAPILILNRKYSSNGKTAAIEAGADEYIRWVDDYLEETIASGLALIRRYTELNQSRQQHSSIISKRPLLINVDYHRVYINSHEIKFSKHEFDLLCLLSASPGRVFTNEQLYRGVWGNDYLRDADHGLNSCLKRIRRKLEVAGCTSCRIENIHGVGYRFIQDRI